MVLMVAHSVNVLNATDLCTYKWQDSQFCVLCILPKIFFEPKHIFKNVYKDMNYPWKNSWVSMEPGLSSKGSNSNQQGKKL